MLRSGEEGRGGRGSTIAQPPSPASGSHSQAIKSQPGKPSSKNNPSDGSASAAIGTSCSNRDDLTGNGDNSEEIEDENEELSDDEGEGTDGYKKGIGALEDD